MIFLFPDLSLSVQERRTALVIGNGSYKSAPLRNPVNDAKDIASALRKLGFTVIHKQNATQRDMETSIRKFGERLRKGGVGLFYYAGHGLQVNGINYIIPLDAEIREETDVKYEAVDARRVLDAMYNAGNDLNIVILDACRDNPLARGFRSGSNGLARMDAPKGTIVAYSTSPGKLAFDGKGRNSPYTAALVDYMDDPGLTIEQVFKKCRRRIDRATNGKQIPWESTSLTGDFYFSTKGKDNRFSEEQARLERERRELEGLRAEIERKRQEIDRQNVEVASVPQKSSYSREKSPPEVSLVFPKPKGLVNDFANVISPAYKQKITAVTGALLQKTGIPVVVVTMPDIGGAEYNDYANRLYRAWGIGKKGEDKGVLIFVTVKERKMRIETGYGVEGILPDGLVGEIRDRHLIPFLKQDKFGEGLLAGASAVAQVIAKNAGIVLTGSNVTERDRGYIAYANGIVKDKSTGLEWKAGPDKDTDWNEARSWVQSLNLDGGGWRMPTMDELENLYKKGTGWRNMTSLLKTTGYFVWSGETKGSSDARYFGFYDGSRSWCFRDGAGGARAFAVRSRSGG